MELELGEEKIRGIVAHMAHLRSAYGAPFANPDLIEPNADYFPDDFALDPESIAKLLRRMLAYAPVSESLEVGLGFIEEGEQGAGGGCGAGACGTGGLKEVARGHAVETEDGYGVLVHVQDVGDPTILTATIARSLGRVVMFEADEEVDPRDEGALSELTAIASGFGILLLNGACIYKKGCGGMKRHRATFLDLDEIAIGLALFVRVTSKKPGIVRRHLEITQKETFDAALAWVDAQPSLVRALVDQPETLEDGVFEFESKRGLFSRLFSRTSDAIIGSPSASASPSPSASPKRTERSAEQLRRIAEAKALVDEALSDP